MEKPYSAANLRLYRCWQGKIEELQKELATQELKLADPRQPPDKKCQPIEETLSKQAAIHAFWAAMAVATSAQNLYEATPEQVESYVFDQRKYHAPKNNTVWDDVRTPEEFIELGKQGLLELHRRGTLFPVNRMTAGQKWVMNLLGVSVNDLAGAKKQEPDDLTLDGSSFFRNQQGGTPIARTAEALEAYAGEEHVAVAPQIANCKLRDNFYEFLSEARVCYSILFIHDKRLFGLLDSRLSLEQLEDEPWEELEPYIKEVLWEITPDTCKEAIAKLYEKVHRVEPTEGEVLLPLTGDGSWLLDKIPEEEFVETLSQGALSVEREKDTLEAILKHFKRIFSRKRQKLPAENNK